MSVLSGELARARALVADRLGLEFGSDREAELCEGLEQATSEAGSSSLDAHLARLAREAGTSPEWGRLAALLTVGETFFFRDPDLFHVLETAILPDLLGRRAGGPHPLRLWSAACASGEEAYSLSIVVQRLLGEQGGGEVSILGTDINPRALEKARRASYGAWSLRGLAPETRERYFDRVGKQFVLRPRFRGVDFELENLASPHPRPLMDVILCRNALMYLTETAAQAACAALRASLAEDGWLIVAAAEASAQRFAPLAPVLLPGVIAFRSLAADESRPTRPVTLPPPPSPVRRARRPPPRAVPAAAPSDASETLRSARAAADEGRVEEAFRLCQEAMREERLRPEAYRLAAEVHVERGDMEGALAALRRAVYLEPDSPEAHSALGHLLLRLGDHRRGRKHVETAIGLAKRGLAS